MSARLRDDSGFTLIELMVTAVVSLIILSATLYVVSGLARQERRTEISNDQQQQVRVTLDRMARQLRNLASPTLLTSISGTLPRSVERDLPYDLAFQDVDQTMPAGSSNSANVRRLRYCLDTTTPSNATLWMETQTWTTATAPVMPSTTACPGSGWTTQVKVATHVTNAWGATQRPLFTYSGDNGTITATDSASRADIDRVGADVFSDTDVTRPPAETDLQTTVFLRNQNREPTSQFTLTVTNSTTRTIQLNGSASQDPEGQTLTYVWNVDGVDQATKGIVVALSLPAGTHTIYLKAFDPAGLEGDSPTQQVTL
jgi:prepilin-type N-terminal cleavage/methylation domain-containing protein